MAVPPSATELFAALRILVLIDEERGLFDRGAEEGGYLRRAGEGARGRARGRCRMKRLAVGRAAAYSA